MSFVIAGIILMLVYLFIFFSLGHLLLMTCQTLDVLIAPHLHSHEGGNKLSYFPRVQYEAICLLKERTILQVSQLPFILL